MIALPFQQKVLRKLLDKPENLKCADCNSKSPTWASLDYGVFVCLNCSGAHRKLGPRNTRIKSTTLDTWYTQWAQLMILDNQLINLYWEYNLNDKKKPTSTSSQEQINRFVEQKYLKKKFADHNRIAPIIELKERRNQGETISSSQQFRRKHIVQETNLQNQIQQNLWDVPQQPQIKPNPIVNNPPPFTSDDIISFDQPPKKSHSIDEVNIHPKLLNPHPQQHHVYSSQSLLSKPIQNQNNFINFQSSNLNFWMNGNQNIQNVPNVHHYPQYQYHQPQYHQQQNQYHLPQYHSNQPVQHHNRFFENPQQTFTYNNQINYNPQPQVPKQHNYQTSNLNFYDTGLKIDNQINTAQNQFGNKMYKEFDQFR